MSYVNKWRQVGDCAFAPIPVYSRSFTLQGLFTLTSIGLIPFRALDTYRVYWIWYYKRRTRQLRQKAGLPQLYDVDDLPDPVYDENYVHVLSEREQADLHYRELQRSSVESSIDICHYRAVQVLSVSDMVSPTWHFNSPSISH